MMNEISLETNGLRRDTYSFIIRISFENLDSRGKPVVWRGSIERVGEGKRLYFQDLESIINFIQGECRINLKAVPWWQTLWTKIRHGLRFET